MKIERFLLDFSYISLKDKDSKSNKSIIYYKLISRKFNILLTEEESILLNYINRSRKISFS